MNTILIKQKWLKRIDEKNIEIIQMFLASISFVMIFLSLFSSFKYEEDGDMRISRFVFWTLGLIFFFCAYTIKSTTVKEQLRIILGVVFLIELLLFPALRILLKDSAVFAVFSYVGTLFLSVLLFCIDRSFWKSLILKKKTLCIISATILLSLAGILYLHHNTVYFLWDSHDMFELIRDNDVYSLWNFSQLALSEHVSYSYAAMCTIFKLLVGDTMTGQALFGFVLYAIGVYGFYKCIDLFSQNANKTDHINCIICMFALYARNDNIQLP